MGRRGLASTPEQRETLASLLSKVIVERARDELGRPAAVDVIGGRASTLRSVASLHAAGRVPSYDGIVIVVTAHDVLAVRQRLLRDLVDTWPSAEDAPRVVVVLAGAATESAVPAEAEARVHELAVALPDQSAPSVLHVEIDRTGGPRDAALVATAVVQALGLDGPAATRAVDDAVSREVEVDRSLRALRGRTSHLRRALVLAQNSFDVPYAQLNLVSHGTLRSLAHIGRSSDGLPRSLSAEAVQQHGPLLVADTQESRRFTEIPETRGPAAIRYYVGHPVHARSGHAVGVLCVLDTEPHCIEQGDDVLIRDLALLAEGELAALTESA